MLLTVCEINSLTLKQYFAHSHFLNCCCKIFRRIVSNVFFSIIVTTIYICKFILLISFLQIVQLENTKNLSMNFTLYNGWSTQFAHQKTPAAAKPLQVFVLFFVYVKFVKCSCCTNVFELFVEWIFFSASVNEDLVKF